MHLHVGNAMCAEDKHIASWLRAEFVNGRSLFDWLFLLTGIAVQVIVYWKTETDILSLISGLAGICSVILCSQGKISTFFFGFIQISTYLYLSLMQHLYAEVGMNVFYFISQIYGIWAWKRRYKTDNEVNQLVAKRLTAWRFLTILITTIGIALAAGWLLSRYTDDSQPYLDALTTIPAIVAQVLMVMTYREQWYIWLLVDILSAAMWIHAGDWCLTAQYIFWCANCLYGLKKWAIYRE